MSFQKAVEFVLKHEGGLVDDPRDPGGLTNFGISRRAYPDADIRGMTRKQAVEIYHRDYWLPVSGDSLPEPVALILFDMAVNMGRDRAVRVLQRACKVKEDGRLGPQTIAACVAQRDGLPLALTRERILAYAETANFNIYRRGWVNRSLAAMQEASA